MNLISFFFALPFVFFHSLAWGQSTLLENLEDKSQTRWRAFLAATHTDGFGDTRVEPTTLASLGLSYSLSKKTYVDTSLRFTKVYYVDFGSEHEFKFSDPYVAIRHHLDTKIFGAMSILSYGLSLPISEYSRRHSVYTKPYVSLSASWMFFKNLLTITTSGSGQYFINGYTTTKTSRESVGGSVLPRLEASGGLSATFVFGQLIPFKYKILKSLLLTAGGRYSRMTFERLEVLPSGHTAFRTRDDAYGLSATLAFSPFKNWFASVGYGYNGEIEVLGRTEYHLYDPLSSRWRAGLRYSKRF